MSQPDYDVAIVGAGPVGGTLACALASQHLRVALLDARGAAAFDFGAGRDLRVNAITQSSVRIFQALGIWQEMSIERLSPFREIHVWDATGDGAIHFVAEEIGAQQLGYMIENKVVQSALTQRLHQLESVTWFFSESLKTLRFEDEKAVLLTEQGRTVEARLVVGADGTDSPVRQQAGIAAYVCHYPETALVANVRPSQPHHGIAWQRFMPSGPLAFLPLTEGEYSIVWTLPSERASQLLALEANDFLAELQAALGSPPPTAEGGVGSILDVGERAGFPLRLLCTGSFIRPRLALVGDAAHTVHPLAGQGVNLGLSDAAALAEVIAEGMRKGKDPGSYNRLRRYERWRKGHAWTMLGSLEGLHRLFDNDWTPLRWARNFGLNLTDASYPIKHRFMRYAMGITGDAPRLMRGLPLLEGVSRGS